VSSYFLPLLPEELKNDLELQYAAITKEDGALDYSAFFDLSERKRILHKTKEVVELLLRKTDEINFAYSFGETYFKDLSTEEQKEITINLYKDDFHNASLRINPITLLEIDEDGITLLTVFTNHINYAIEKTGGDVSEEFCNFIYKICSMRMYCTDGIQKAITRIAKHTYYGSHLDKNKLVKGFDLETLKKEAVNHPMLLNRVMLLDPSYEEKLFTECAQTALNKPSDKISKAEIEALASYYNRPVNKKIKKETLKTLIKVHSSTR
jgi:hypothetical protein